MITADQVLTHKNDLEGQQRTAEALNLFVQGELSLRDIGNKLGIDGSAVYYLVKKNITLIEADKAYNKALRVNRLQRIFNNIPDDIAPKSIDEVCKITSELRKEIEGDKPSVEVNVQNVSQVFFPVESSGAFLESNKENA